MFIKKLRVKILKFILIYLVFMIILINIYSGGMDFQNMDIYRKIMLIHLINLHILIRKKNLIMGIIQKVPGGNKSLAFSAHSIKIIFKGSAIISSIPIFFMEAMSSNLYKSK